MHIQNFSVLVTPYLLLCVPSEQQLQLSVINYTSSSLYTRSCMERTTKQHHEKQYRISVGVTRSKCFYLSIDINVHVQFPIVHFLSL